MNLSPRNKLMVVVALAVLLVAALVAGLVVPAAGRIGTLRDQIETAKADAEAARTLVERRREIRDRAAATDARALQLAVAVPENPDLPSLIIDLQDLASDSGVFLRSLQPGQIISSEASPHVAMPISLQVEGTWADVVDFLQQLRRLPRQLRITDVAAGVLPESSAEDDGGTGVGITTPPYYQVRADINLIAYFIPAGSLTSPTAPPPAPAPEQ